MKDNCFTEFCCFPSNLNMNQPSVQFNSIQSLSNVWLFAIPWTAAYQASLSITNSQSLLKLMSIVSVIPSNHLILSSPSLLSSIFPSIRVFSNKSVLHIRWPKYWSFSFSITPSSEYSGFISFQFSSVQFSRSVVADSLRPHESQPTRPPCPSPIPRVHSDSRPLSQWCHSAISSSVIPFSSCPNPFQHQSLFQWVNTWDGQSTGASALASVLSMNIQDWSLLGLTGLIYLLSKGL